MFRDAVGVGGGGRGEGQIPQKKVLQRCTVQRY